MLARKEKGRTNGVRPSIPRNWLRGLDLNQRPSGYEPDELPGCSTPRVDDSGYTELRQTAAGASKILTQGLHQAWASLTRRNGLFVGLPLGFLKESEAVEGGIIQKRSFLGAGTSVGRRVPGAYPATQPVGRSYFLRYVILLFLPPETNSKMISLLPSSRALP